MSRDNIEVVRRLYEALNGREPSALVGLAAADVEWVHDPRVGAGPIRGLDEVVRYFTDQAEMFDGVRIDVEDTWEGDDTVLAFVHVTGRGSASGAGFDIRIAHLWTLSDGVVVRGQAFASRDRAREATGLGPG